MVFCRCLKLNRYSLEVHKMKILFLLCRDGKYDEAAEGIGELIQYYDRYEPKSHCLYYEAGKLFSRVVIKYLYLPLCEARVLHVRGAPL